MPRRNTGKADPDGCAPLDGGNGRGMTNVILRNVKARYVRRLVVTHSNA